MKRATFWRRTRLYAAYRKLWWRWRDRQLLAQDAWLDDDPAELRACTRGWPMALNWANTATPERTTWHVTAPTPHLAACRLLADLGKPGVYE